MNLKPFELAALCRRVRDAMQFDPIYLVLRSSSSGKPQFLLIGEGPEFEKGLRTYYIESDYEPLGLLAWEQQGEYYQARNKPFPWTAKDPKASREFDQICDMGADTVRQLVDPDCLH